MWVEVVARRGMGGGVGRGGVGGRGVGRRVVV
jgi:hypothetical protein